MKSRHFSLFLILMMLNSPCRVISQPSIDGFKVYYGDLHNHCNISDGTGTASEAYAYARDVAHYDFFGLSDHANLISSSEWTLTKNTANTYNQDSVFTAFHGFEWTTYLSYGHVTIVNTDDYCSNSSPTNNFSGLLNWVNARNCIAFFNHPGWEFYTYYEFNHFTDVPSSRFVGMELWNTLDGFNKYYYNDGYYSGDGNKGYYDEALIRHWKTGAAGGDDNHSSTWGTASQFRTGVLAKANTRADIFSAYQAKRFFSTLDKNLVLSMKINGYDMGSTIQGGTWNVVINAFDTDNEVITNVYLLKNGTIIYAWVPNTPHPSLVKSISCANGDYFYVRVKQADGDEAISSPIFISGTAAQPPQVTLTSPAGGSVYTCGLPVTLDASAVDPDGSIAAVEFYCNNVLIGQDNTTPFSISWTTALTGQLTLKAKAIDNTGLTAYSNSVEITMNPQLSNYVVNHSIMQGSDDVEECSTGEVLLTHPELKLVYEPGMQGCQTVGLMFRNLNIPRDATVFKAYIQFTSSETDGEASRLEISGERSFNPLPFKPELYNVTSRDRTSVVASWYPGVWKEPYSHGLEQRTPDLSNMIMEILKAGDSTYITQVVFLLSGEGLRRAAAYENSPEWAAQLYVEFTAPVAMQGVSAPSVPVVKTIAEISSITQQEVMIFPNPTEDIAYLRFRPDVFVQDISVYTVSGILLENIIVNEAIPERAIHCKTFPPGLYLVKVRYTDHLETCKLIRKPY